MKKNLFVALATMAVAVVTALASPVARAQSDVSAASALSTLPIASVVVGSAVTASAVVALPVALSTTGAVLVVKTVEVSARVTVCVLERASDGAVASVELIGRGASAVSLAAGTVVGVTVIGSGVVLSAAGEAIAFVPNALGRALLHNERLTY